LPLAIELAAARSKLFTVEQLLDRLGERLDLLRGGRDADPRQQTLRATIEWSYELLTDEERQLFTRLAVFAGGCTFDAAEHVAGADPEPMQSLVEKSMLRRTGERFWMLETIREFAIERLDELDNEPLRRAYAEYYTQLAEAADELGPSAVRTRQLDSEWANFRSVLDWSCQGNDPAVALRLTAALWRPWWERGAIREGAAWYDAALAIGHDQPEELRARAWYGAADMAMARQDVAEANALLEQCVAVFRRIGDDLRVMRALNDLGIVAQAAGDFDRGRRFHEESLAMALADDNGPAAASARINLANAALAENRLDEARAQLLDIIDSVALAGNEGEHGTVRQTLAMVDLRAGDPVSAARHLTVSIPLARGTAEWRTIGHALASAGAALAALGKPEAATRALAACEALCADGGFALENAEHELVERTIAEVREAMGEPEFERTWAEWLAASPESTVSRVLDDLSEW
jgi:tetratricopeptide (TPR) repeat protein